ncbi:hypothetical protein OS493_027186 [Desmophyllum pertusum]|uniref:Developmental pluripotency-associated protein 2/4 C-terminal domain-containing protein n=1 Tax=Desmophyllum pertusum TaxID=174260 RepID=A0A9X0D7E1_9CNID|nr:hypothetical protein OS493_027186 [Desmophyllum pertusum]
MSRTGNGKSKVDNINASEIQGMKRARITKLCKQLGLKASGKNTELQYTPWSEYICDVQQKQKLTCSRKQTTTRSKSQTQTKLKSMLALSGVFVEGLLKQESNVQWKRLHLMGGKVMVSNSFGKSVSFVLESCGLTTPDNCDDNYICGACVRDNEAALRLKCSSRIPHSSVTPQEVDIELGATCSTPMSSNHTLLTSFSRVGFSQAQGEVTTQTALWPTRQPIRTRWRRSEGKTLLSDLVAALQQALKFVEQEASSWYYPETFRDHGVPRRQQSQHSPRM